MKVPLPDPTLTRFAAICLVLFAAVAAIVWPGAAPILAVALAILAILLLTGLRMRGAKSAIRRQPAKQDFTPAGDGRAMLDALPDPVVLFDRKGDVLHANRASYRVFSRITVGSDIRLSFRSPQMMTLVEQVLETGEAKAREVMFRLPVEHVFDVHMTALEGVQDMCICVFSDRSEVRRIERMRSDFIANASHELRTPLASIAGFIETLEGPASGDRAATARFLSIMKSQAERMARLIDDLLSLSRLEMNASARRDEAVDLAELAQSVIGSLSGVAADNGVVIERAWPDGDWRVAGSKDELHQVLENLVSNACKYGSDGKRVVVSFEQASLSGQAAVKTTVQDFGVGIPKEHVSRITERFYRVEQGNAKAHKGTGLGLAIVKHIVTLHRGRLMIDSDVGQGAKFSFVLPSYGGGKVDKAARNRHVTEVDAA